MTVRPAERRDIPESVEMVMEWEREGPLMTISRIDRTHVTRLFELYCTGGCFCGIVAEEEGRVVAGIGGMVAPALFNSNELVAWQQFFYALPAHRGGLTALRLLRAFEAWAKSKGARALVVSASRAFDQGHIAKLYVKLGFQPYDMYYVKEVNNA